MAFKTENKNGVTLCYVDGEIDINTAPALKKSFDRLITQKTPKIVINFKGVTYIDSSGLATLVEILKNMRVYGGALRLSNLSSKIRSLFEITKLEKLFQIYTLEEEAISGF